MIKAFSQELIGKILNLLQCAIQEMRDLPIKRRGGTPPDCLKMFLRAMIEGFLTWSIL